QAKELALSCSPPGGSFSKRGLDSRPACPSNSSEEAQSEPPLNVPLPECHFHRNAYDIQYAAQSIHKMRGELRLRAASGKTPGHRADDSYGHRLLADSRDMRTSRAVLRPAEKTDRPLIRSDHVRRQIADQIISGALRPGQELDEKKLAEAFNVSRTPVREALKQLAAANLVEWRPHQSAIVAKITPSKMVEMFEVMAELEGFCGRLAARRMTPKEQANLVAIHKKFRPCVESNDREGYHELNKTFH